jgi:predicted GTPase
MKELRGQLDRVKGVCAQISGLGQIEKKIEELEMKLVSQEIIIPLIGEFSAGKSALLNAVLGKEVLPIDILPTTFTINEVRFSKEKDRIEIYYGDEKKKEIDGLINLNEINYSEAKLVRIFTTNNAVSEKIVIVDAPGLSSDISRHEQILLEYLPKSDAVFLVIDVNQGALTRTTQKFLESVQFLNKDVFVVFSKSDLKNPDELHELKEYAETKFPVKPQEVIFTSAKNNDVGEFIALLKKINMRGEEILRKRISERLVGICKEAINLIDLQIHSAELDTSEIDEKINELRRELENVRREMERRLERTKEDVQNAVSVAVDKFRNIMYMKAEALTDLAFSYRESPEKLESAFDDAIKEAGTIALKSCEAALVDIIKQLQVDMEEIAKRIDVGKLPLGKSLIDGVTLVITTVLLDVVLPGGIFWAALGRLGVAILEKLPLVGKLWETIETPIREILANILKPITRSFVKNRIIKAVDNAVFEFREILSRESAGIINSVRRDIEEKFSASEKGFIDSIESLKKEKEKKVSEFKEYINKLKNGKEVLIIVMKEVEDAV